MLIASLISRLRRESISPSYLVYMVVGMACEL